MAQLYRKRCSSWVYALVGAIIFAVSSSFALAQTGKAPMHSSLPRVLVLATGGTISGKASERSAISYDAGAVTGEDLIAGVPGIEKLARLKAEQISNIPSQNMNSKVWFRLAERINQVFAHNEADAVVITHGTDTMEETAFFLDKVIKTSHPVILTGAMRPSTAISADGPANMYEAVKVAVDPAAQGRGVMIVLNDTIHAARWVTKTSTTSLETFKSQIAGPIGAVDAASVRFFGPPVSFNHIALPTKQNLPQVRIIYAHADMDAQQIDEAVKAGAAGLVIAGMGDGNVSQEALSGLDRAVKAGVIIVRSARVGEGFVNRNVEVNDDEHGLVVSYDLNPQKARILLQLLLANHVRDKSKIQQDFLARY
ncbi:asparaginase [Aristophania vespae]|uniref:asparaginase n=1 Tax=Aristophania vespae TaxID=2697033 RepID=UPI0023515603|nr:asparaginase [Aristophania vespae]UMM63921.1 L-asparaginase [Aristophania vespae]